MTSGLDELQHCIDECEQCRDTSLRTVVHCLRRGGRGISPRWRDATLRRAVPPLRRSLQGSGRYCDVIVAVR